MNEVVSCTELKGVGPRLASLLQKLQITTVMDLLFHFPYRYQDRTRLSPIGSVRVDEYVVIEGTIIQSQVKFGRRPVLLCTLRDASGELALCFFNFTPGQQKKLVAGETLRCFGQVGYHFSRLTMVHPEYQHLAADTIVVVEEALTPIYHSTAGLSQLKLRQLMQQALTVMTGCISEILPHAIIQQFQLMDIVDAVCTVHRPPPDIVVDRLNEYQHPAQQRLIFEELLAHVLSISRLRQKIRSRLAYPLIRNQELPAHFLAQLPYPLTAAQCKVSAEIAADLAQEIPMQRLLQGDVGCGKTVVAALAALQAIESGCQVALMVPTELLAEQHAKNFKQWLQPLGLELVCLVGSLTKKQRQQALDDIVTQRVVLVIGTHALFQQAVQFSHLGLVIVDEQHRFGVQQREELQQKGMTDTHNPHLLIMTATPIPRTLYAMTGANLAISVIDELPPNRMPVTTAVVPNTRRDEVIERIRIVCQAGRQVYWVCPLIDESSVLLCEAAENTVTLLTQALPDVRTGLLHGRMNVAEKAMIMEQFERGELTILVATTVIEVGVDVPNASLMIVENPERLGLAQLHQLRGRVGRGGKESYCILLYKPPLTEEAKQRLRVIRSSNDGFWVAEQDLILRGPGEVLGLQQSGALRMRIADLTRDQSVLPQVRQAAGDVLQSYPDCVELVLQRWLVEQENYGI